MWGFQQLRSRSSDPDQESHCRVAVFPHFPISPFPAGPINSQGNSGVGQPAIQDDIRIGHVSSITEMPVEEGKELTKGRKQAIRKAGNG